MRGYSMLRAARKRPLRAFCALMLTIYAGLAAKSGIPRLRAGTFIERNYQRVLNTPGDIHEHLPTLYNLAAQGTTAAEFGVRSVISTFALLRGLRDSQLPGERRLVCLDSEPIHAFQNLVPASAREGVIVTAVQHDSATYRLPFPVDLLLLDTWHVYGHVRRELARHSGMVAKYIAMHDTDVDGVEGESIRNARSDLPWMVTDVQVQAQASGYPVEEITRGLQPAIDEFLKAHQGEWVLHKKYRNNNGLTVLRRIKPAAPAAAAAAAAGIARPGKQDPAAAAAVTAVSKAA